MPLRRRNIAWFKDYFQDLGAWTPLVGTAAAVANKLQGTTQGNVGANLLSDNDSEFTTSVAGWTALGGATVTRVDSEVDPGVNSGGVNKWAKKIVSPIGNGYASILPSSTIGAIYKTQCRAYSPSANTSARPVYLFSDGADNRISAEDAWETLTVTKVTAATSLDLRGFCFGAAADDIGYFDAFTVYRQNTVYLLNSGLWNSPNATITVALPQPASPSVVPVGVIFRYTDSLNYWEVRIQPNTAGTDTSIVEVVAGVETVRASSDTDWSVDGSTDQVKIVLAGTVCTVTKNRNGEGWGAACAYATMGSGLSSSQLGIILYDTALGRISSFEVTQ
jgi:hypothetical protein